MDPTKNCRRNRADMGCGTDGRTDGQTGGWSETNIPPNNFVVRGGIIKKPVQKSNFWKLACLLHRCIYWTFNWQRQFRAYHVITRPNEKQRLLSLYNKTFAFIFLTLHYGLHQNWKCCNLIIPFHWLHWKLFVILTNFLKTSEEISVQHLTHHIDGLVQERRNYIAKALELVFLALTYWYVSVQGISTSKLEQLERLCSENTPGCLMITHTIESYWIPSQKKTKSKLQI